MKFVAFQLIAPMGAFGLGGGHEYRRSEHYPPRSALLGLIGAALGVRRDDKDGQGALADLATAVAVCRVQEGLRDFHTIQAVPTARIKNPSTRVQALAHLKPSDNASITRRDYLTDCAYIAAVWPKGDWAPSQEQLLKALRKPVFIPYLGRKSCPMSHPMSPEAISAEDPVQALETYIDQHLLDPLPMPQLFAAEQMVHFDQVQWQYDDPQDRETWQFTRRKSYVRYGPGGQR